MPPKTNKPAVKKAVTPATSAANESATEVSLKAREDAVVLQEQSLADEAKKKTAEFQALKDGLDVREKAVKEREAKAEQLESQLNGRKVLLDEREENIQAREKGADGRDTAANNSGDEKKSELGPFVKISSKRAKGHFRAGMHHPRSGHNVSTTRFTKEQLAQLALDEFLSIEAVDAEQDAVA